MVVRESMSMDLLDRLICDICTVTEALMNSDAVDLAAWQPASASIEKQYSSRGVESKDRHLANRQMDDGVHRSVC